MTDTPAQFKRETRYAVFKLKDVQSYLTTEQIHALVWIGDAIDAGRLKDGKPSLDSVVVEQDWPEFEPVFAMIEARVTGVSQSNGWYCSQCQCGVDPSDVTFNETHTVCGRRITDDIPPQTTSTHFQRRVQPWMMACFGPVISADREERNHRFLEEALELVQACGCTASEARQLVEYVFGRPAGEPAQEVGGVMVTLAALCLANGLDMHANGEAELARIWTKVDQIRAKQAAKPRHSPLPQHAALPTGEELRRDIELFSPRRNIGFLSYGEDNDGWYVERDGTQIAHGMTEDDARRFAACANACSGIKLEVLESLLSRGSTLIGRFADRGNDTNRVIRQAEAMRSALRSFINVMDFCSGHPDTSGERQSLRHAADEAREALKAWGW